MNFKVIVYVEGPSDKAALHALLSPLIEQKNQMGIGIDFFEAPSGDKKASVLTKVPRKAASILVNDPRTIVVAMPDLYPRNKAFPHETAPEAVEGVTRNFESALRERGQGDDARYRRRFRVFCFKHDLEALILSCEDNLKGRLGVRSLGVKWRVPVEDQNHDSPPKRIVEALYQRHGQRYKDTVDAPVILGASNYEDLTAKCPQCFKPFVEFLISLTDKSF